MNFRSYIKNYTNNIKSQGTSRWKCPDIALEAQWLKDTSALAAQNEGKPAQMENRNRSNHAGSVKRGKASVKGNVNCAGSANMKEIQRKDENKTESK